MKKNLDIYPYLVVLYYKENFRLSYGENEVSFDYCNKRQVSCLGVSLIYYDGNSIKTEYVAYLSDILNHDSLFSGDVLEMFFSELDQRFKFIDIFTDCGPHFRSKEFLYKIKNLSIKRNIPISLNFFGEYDGKTIVDGFFGRLSKIFKIMDYKYKINDVNELKE